MNIRNYFLLKAKHVRHYFESNGVLNSDVRLTCIVNNFSNVFTQRKAKREWLNKIIIHYKKRQILQSVTIDKEYVNSTICQKKNNRVRSRYFCSRGSNFYSFTPFILNELFSTLDGYGDK